MIDYLVLSLIAYAIGVLFALEYYKRKTRKWGENE